MSTASSRAEEATSVHYRVELIVLRHLDSAAEPDVEPALEDHSAALDIVPREQETGGEDESAGETSTGAEPPADPYGGAMEHHAPGLVALEELPPPPPPPAVWMETPGDTMQEAWRRMRLSAGFRPVMYFSWEQPDSEPAPRVRVHDDRVIWIDDPYAELRAAAPGEIDPALPAPEPRPESPAGPATGPPPESMPPVTETLPGSEPPSGEVATEPEAEAEIPEPTLHFALDGTARLRRSRFLHLDLDIGWRERLDMLAPTAGGPATAAGQPGVLGPAGVANVPGGVRVEDPLATPPDAVRVHRLRQSRQVSTGRLQYFDGPWFGVLALVTRIERANEPEPGPESSPGPDTTPP